MSTVTNVIFVMSVDEFEATQALQRISSFQFGTYWQPLKDDITGGSKNLECEIYIGAFNYFDEDKFVDELKMVEWKYPEEIQVMVRRQDDDKFITIYVGEEKEEGK